MDEPVRWVLVAGSGKQYLPADRWLPKKLGWTARLLGRQLARQGYGLVSGGWQGVDFVTAEAFAGELRRQGQPLSTRLITVKAQGTSARFDGGLMIEVPSGPMEWLEGLKYAEAVVLLGGRGGTMRTYDFARQELKPVFPIRATGGDAELVFDEMLANWPMHAASTGVDKTLFEAALAHPVEQVDDAAHVAEAVLTLIASACSGQAARLGSRLDAAERGPSRPVTAASGAQVFISYKREDRPWMERLLRLLRLIESEDRVLIWADSAIQPGQRWRDEIEAALQRATVGVLLLSPPFLESDFIRNEELPAILDAASQGRLKLVIVPLRVTDLQGSPIAEFQAVFDPIREPLEAQTEAERHASLVTVAEWVKRMASGTNP